MKNFCQHKINVYWILLIVLLVAGIFRLYGLNWDQHQHLHPDERFLTMVTIDLKWPTTIASFFNLSNSYLNPYNVGHSFFVYGTFPLILVKFISSFISLNPIEYHNVSLVGRLVSALFDISTTGLIFLIGKRVINQSVGVLSSFFYSLMVLPIQLSHFYAVDTFLVFFLVLTFYFLLNFISGKRMLINSLIMGIAFGLALACKISALLALPLIALSFGFNFIFRKNRRLLFLCVILFVLISSTVFKTTDTHVFSSSNLLNLNVNQKFLENLQQLKYYSSAESDFPPSIQWLSTKPYVYPAKNLIVWGAGLPISVLAFAGTFFGLRKIFNFFKNAGKKSYRKKMKVFVRVMSFLMILFWVGLLFIYQGYQFAKTMRYFYPIYPFLAFLSAVGAYNIFRKRKTGPITAILGFSLVLIYPISFLSIYSKPHTRVQASEWILENIPRGSTISCEYWDDCLPLLINNNDHGYKTETLHMYETDTKKKWVKINDQLRNIDYLILSSNRLWRPIQNVPGKYPIASKFYKDLFSGKLGFFKVAEFTSRPTIPFTKIEFVDDNADESFTVFDHPKVMIFKKGK